MKKIAAHSIIFLLGFLFAFGLGVGGMLSPQKIQGFLDVVGSWDSDLLYVLGASVFVTALLFPLILRRDAPLLHHVFVLPNRKDIDRKLVVGSVLFGIGWALTGLCPGPAVASISAGATTVFLYVGVLVCSYFVYENFFLLFSKK